MAIQWVVLPHAHPDTKTMYIGNKVLPAPSRGYFCIPRHYLLITYLPGTNERGLCFFLDVTEML